MPILTDADRVFATKIIPLDPHSLIEAIVHVYPAGLPPEVPSWAELLFHAVT